MIADVVTLVFVIVLGVCCDAAEGFSACNGSKRNICLVLDEPFQNEGNAIVSSLGIPAILPDCQKLIAGGFDHRLRLVTLEVAPSVTTYALGLEHIDQQSQNRQVKKRPKQVQKSNPFYIDLCPPENSRIGKRGRTEGGSDLLVKAVGPTKCVTGGRSGAIIYDLTAGLGQDSLVLALNGAHKIIMVERDPIVGAMLEDALRRLEMQGSTHQMERAEELSRKLVLHRGDSLEILKELKNSGEVSPDVVYLDPMFPPRTKSAKVKKGMSLLHGLLETQDTDEATEGRRLEEETRLLQLALETAACRVVVKRPAKATTLGADATLRPSYALEGSVNRWDVYVKAPASE